MVGERTAAAVERVERKQPLRPAMFSRAEFEQVERERDRLLFRLAANVHGGDASQVSADLEASLLADVRAELAREAERAATLQGEG